MKKIFVLLTAVLLVGLLIAGCSSSGKTNADLPSVQAPATPSQQGPRVETKGRPVVMMFTADW